MFGRLTGLVGLAALASVALAGPQSFSQRVQTIRAGIVILPTAKQTLTAAPTSAAPYALYNLDSNTAVKPSGWSFQNPYGPSRVSQDIFNRWITIDTNTPPVLTPISKRNAAYWEVFLDQVTDTQLANYDLLLVNPSAFASLNPAEQERLRRFVDHGGVLWIDPAGLNPGVNGMDEFNPFPIPFLQLQGAAVGIEQTDFTNALTNSIQPLGPGDIDALDVSVDPVHSTSYFLSNIDFTTQYNGAAAGIADLAGGAPWDFARLQTVSVVNGNPVLSLGRIGDGFVVVTARGASLKLNRSHAAGFSYTANSFFTGLPPVLDSDGVSAAKLAVNMVGLLREFRQQGGGSSKVSSSAIDLDPPLINRSTVQDNGYVASQSLGTPAFYKGLLVTTSNGVLKVYDADPPTDLDGDGNPDDGQPDYEYGASYDLVWSNSSMTGPLSAPVCCELPGGGSIGVTDIVLVVDGQGNLHAFNLEPKSNGVLQNTSTQVFQADPPNGNPTLDSAYSPIPLAPTVHEGIAYITDNTQRGVGNLTGRVWQVDLSTGHVLASAGPFVIGGTGSPVSLPEFTYGCTVGYIPILDNSGGADKVLYAPFAGNPLGGGIPSAGFTSIWLGSRGERPITFDPQPGNTASALQVTTRASQQGGLPIFVGTGSLAPKLTLLDANGNALPAATIPVGGESMSTIFQGNVEDLGGGVLSFPFKAGVTSLPANITGVRVDYTIDWGTAITNSLASVERGRVMLPDQNGSATRSILGGVALSPQGTAYVVQAPLPPSSPAVTVSGGALYGFREAGRGLFNCIDRYELYNGHNVTLNQSATAQVGPLFVDNDGLNQLIPILQGTLSNFEFVGGPSIRNGQVVVTAAAKKAIGIGSGGLNVTVLMAFNAEPPTPQFNVGVLPDGSEFLQPDMARSTNLITPEVQSVLPGGSYTYDSDTGYVSFPNLSSVQRGQLQNVLSLSQPVILRKPGQADVLLQPDTLGGSFWNTLQWFHVVNGMTPGGGAPLITGDSVFIAGSSILPGVLSTPPSFNTTSGLLYAVTAQIPSSQLHPTPTKPWMNQLWSIDPAGFNAFNPTAIGDPNVLWPQLSNVSSLSDFKIKLTQTQLLGSTTAYGVVGGDGALASWGDTGLFTYSKANFVICDEGRILIEDASGNPIWTTDTTTSPGQSNLGSAAVSKSLVRPVRAYKLTDTTMLVVDAGANRVATINMDGVEQRTISSFILDPNVIPVGFMAGEPLKLNGPRDALYYTTYAQMSGVGNLVTIGDGETGTSTEYWQHYLIADTGNKRLVELIDRFYYNPSTGQIGAPVTVGGTPQVGVLLWHSPASATGKQYSYITLNRVLIPDANGGHYVYVCGIGGSLPTRVGSGLDPQQPASVVDAQDGSGGIVIFDPTNPAGVQTISSMSVPDVTGTPFWDPTTGVFDTNIDLTTAAGNQTFVQRKGSPMRRFTNVNSVTAKVFGNGNPGSEQIAIMVADGTGVYEGLYSASAPSAVLNVDWFITNEAFRAIKQTTNGSGATIPTTSNGGDLRALFARRLDSGDVMIVNGYNGPFFGGSGAFQGEVMQIIGSGPNSFNPANVNLGFNSSSITLDLLGKAPGTGTRGIQMPVFADRR